MDIELVRNVTAIRQSAGVEGCMLLQVLEVFGKGQSDTLGHAPVNLTVHDQPVVDLAHIGHDGKTLDSRLSGLGIDCHLGHEKAVHVYGEGRPL